MADNVFLFVPDTSTKVIDVLIIAIIIADIIGLTPLSINGTIKNITQIIVNSNATIDFKPLNPPTNNITSKNKITIIDKEVLLLKLDIATSLSLLSMKYMATITLSPFFTTVLYSLLTLLVISY